MTAKFNIGLLHGKILALNKKRFASNIDEQIPYTVYEKEGNKYPLALSSIIVSQLKEQHSSKTILSS